MRFFESIKTCYSKYATFSGRASRSELWFFRLFCLPFIIIVALLSFIPLINILVWLLYFLIFGIPDLSASIRRLHDTDRSGAWWFIQLVPFVGPIIFFIFMVSDSTSGNNAYDPNPKEKGLSNKRQNYTFNQSRTHNVENDHRQQSRPQQFYSKPQSQSQRSYGSEETEFAGSGQQHGTSQQARLVFAGRIYYLRNGRNIVGRQGETSEATVQILSDDLYMSRQHCCITIEPQSDGSVSAKIANYQNKNKIVVNGHVLRPNEERFLLPNSEITMGRTTMKFTI